MLCLSTAKNTLKFVLASKDKSEYLVSELTYAEWPKKEPKGWSSNFPSLALKCRIDVQMCAANLHEYFPFRLLKVGKIQHVWQVECPNLVELIIKYVHWTLSKQFAGAFPI